MSFYCRLQQVESLCEDIYIILFQAVPGWEGWLWCWGELCQYPGLYCQDTRRNKHNNKLVSWRNKHNNKLVSWRSKHQHINFWKKKNATIPYSMLGCLLLGWSDFWRKKLDTFHVLPNCYRTPIPKFYFKVMLFGLAQGLSIFWLLPLNETKKNLYIQFLNKSKSVP